MTASQPVWPADGEPVQTIVVVGRRAGLETAQAHKREAVGIVDSVVAEDVQKLPDFSVAEALQRVTGVQITRDRGEAGVATIRGLTQMATLLNGRDVFTAGTGRALDFNDIPAEMVARIDVHKSASADQIEGGVGGTIDLVTRRPFDFADGMGIASVRLVHGDLVKRTEPQLSGLWSRRWRTDAGEFGLLFNGALQRRAWREDQKSTGNPTVRSDVVSGQDVTVPSGTTETVSAGRRERSGGSVIAQWRPGPALRLHGELHHAEFRTKQDSYQINVLTPNENPSGPPTVEPGSVELFPGSSDVRRITWLNAPVSVLSFARDTVDRVTNAALGGTWSGESVTVRGDFSATRGYNNLFFSGPVLGATAARFTHDFSGRVPATTVQGTDLLDPANHRFTLLAYRLRPFRGRQEALRFDVDVALGGALHTLSAGLRTARRRADNAPGLVFGDIAVDVPAASRPDAVRPTPYPDFLPGESTPSLRQYLVGDLASARDAAGLRTAFGVSTPLPTSGSPQGVWHIDERTDALYGMGRFTIGALDGDAGMRMVRTRGRMSGSRSAGAGVSSIEGRSSDLDWLPAANLRWRMAPQWQVRAAASRTLTRPSFDQLAPSLTLLPTPGLGSAGNPNLRPVRSRNFDFAVERYGGRGSLGFLTLFYKEIDGFVTTVAQNETHDGQVFLVSRPQNTGRGRIKGVELGGQKFFHQLRGAWSGLGIQANYTYVDSVADGPILGQSATLPNLSRHSANIVGLYEYGGWSVRVAWNWRDRYLSSIGTFPGIGAVPVYTRGYGWLDAALTWRISDRVTWTLEGSNIMHTRRDSYFGVETRPNSNWLNDAQLSMGVTVRF